MTLGVVIAMALLAALCVARRRRRLGLSLYALAGALFLAVGCGHVPAWLLDDLQASYGVKPANAWGQRNAIVVLGAGTDRIATTGCVEPGLSSYARIVEAATLQRDCRKTGAECKILVSGGDALRTGASDAEVYRKAWLSLGLEGADVLIEPNSTTTWQHARHASDVLQQFEADHVVLVSSGVHLRRSQLYFTHFGIDATQVRAEYLGAEKCLLPKAHNFTMADEALHEYMDILRYHLRVATGEIERPRAASTLLYAARSAGDTGGV
ncbi:MAG: YdcF family protein [Comamonas sp.]